MPNIKLLNMDCMEYMSTVPDKYFDLAIVDPPYGIEKGSSATSRVAKYGQLGTVNDLKPKSDYFAELFRSSKNQIIWGYNHLSELLPSTKEFVFWYKQNPVPTYSDGELAWTSFNKTSKVFNFPYYGSINADVIRIHPTQKPVKLYDWILINYAKPEFKILDTHLGSASSAIAAHYFGISEFVGTELDEDYFKAAKDRFDRETAQIAMF